MGSSLLLVGDSHDGTLPAVIRARNKTTLLPELVQPRTAAVRILVGMFYTISIAIPEQSYHYCLGFMDETTKVQGR